MPKEVTSLEQYRGGQHKESSAANSPPSGSEHTFGDVAADDATFAQLMSARGFTKPNSQSTVTDVVQSQSDRSLVSDRKQTSQSSIESPVAVVGHDVGLATSVAAMTLEGGRDVHEITAHSVEEQFGKYFGYNFN